MLVATFIKTWQTDGLTIAPGTTTNISDNGEFGIRFLNGTEIFDAKKLEAEGYLEISGETQYTLNRQTGRSTRLIDFYIQELFTNGQIEVRDHENYHECHKMLFDRIIKRLRAEHRYESNSPRALKLKVNRSALTIKIDNGK